MIETYVLDRAYGGYSMVIGSDRMSISNYERVGTIVSPVEFYEIVKGFDLESYEPTQYYESGDYVIGSTKFNTYIRVSEGTSEVDLMYEKYPRSREVINFYEGRNIFQNCVSNILDDIKFTSECDVSIWKDNHSMKVTDYRIDYISYSGNSQVTKYAYTCNPWDFVDKIQNTCIGGDIEYSNLKAYGEDWTFKLDLINNTFRWDKHDHANVLWRNDSKEVGKYLERYKRFL